MLRKVEVTPFRPAFTQSLKSVDFNRFDVINGLFAFRQSARGLYYFYSACQKWQIDRQILNINIWPAARSQLRTRIGFGRKQHNVDQCVMSQCSIECAMAYLDVEGRIGIVRRTDTDRNAVNKMATVKHDFAVHRRKLSLFVTERAVDQTRVAAITMNVEAVHIAFAQSDVINVVSTEHTPSGIGHETHKSRIPNVVHTDGITVCTRVGICRIYADILNRAIGAIANTDGTIGVKLGPRGRDMDIADEDIVLVAD